MIRATTFEGKRVAVFGLGGSGIVAAQSLVAGGADVVCWDDGEAGRERAAAEGLAVADLNGADWSGFDALVLAPGVPLTHPEPHWTVKLANAHNVEIIGDIEIFAREREALCPDSPFVAITGTNGKSTTTALIAHLLGHLGFDVQMGGNIGRAILTLDAPSPDRVHVVEMSSYQIDLTPTLKPSVGVLLNITPDHIDRHGTLEHYAAVKARLIEGSQYAVVCVDDRLCDAIFELQKAQMHSNDQKMRRERTVREGWYRPILPFDVPQRLAAASSSREVRLGYEARGTRLYHVDRDIENHWQKTRGRERLLADVDGIGSLRGVHNVQNALISVAAIVCLGKQIDLNEMKQKSALIHSDPEVFLKKVSSVPRRNLELLDGPELNEALASFPGLPHRMEEVGRVEHVLFINDSKATNAEAAEKALATFDGGIHWIAGGRAKAGGIEALKPLFPRIEKAYLIGESEDDFARTLEGTVDFERCDTLDVAVARAAAAARVSSAAEPVVLFSPACASFDQFANFEVRGDAFRDAVTALSGATSGEAN
ncbi:MAG: UDP-N-acetylmuramoyl-L-alanine--D-glutamate ligase [Alphaproteobacteria bacterium]|nr:UDP-N-acetylmuramoyl-L-alanine--D-glutamate ligase [Alphaproteobacteria bacterium]